MNERIKELAEQAGFIASAPTLSPTLEQFAELIIKECAQVVEEARWMVPPSQEQIARSIKRHFGVE